MKKIFNLMTIIFIMIFLTPIIAHADIDSSPQSPDSPIDGGLSVLIAAGVGFGIKQLKSHYKKKQHS